MVLDSESAGRTGASETASNFACSDGFLAWLESRGAGLACTAAAADTLWLVGAGAGDALHVFERRFPGARALCARPGRLWLAGRDRIWRLENLDVDASVTGGHDHLYVPQSCRTTGDIGVGGLVPLDDDTVLFASTAFDCLAVTSETWSLRPVWQPPGLGGPEPADCCHLTGVAMEDGRPRYVTVAALSDRPGGWRDAIRDGGAILDTRSGQPVVSGLSLPRAPRLVGGVLYFLDSGTGNLCRLDPATGAVETVTLLPGWPTSMDIDGSWALVGLSRGRGGRGLGDLPLAENLRARQARAQSAVAVVDLRAGRIGHWLRIEGRFDGIDGVALLPGTRRPAVIGPDDQEVGEVVSIGPAMNLATAGPA